MSKLSIAAFSDTHTYHRSVKLPDADVLVFAGDLMGSGYRHSEVKDFGEWFSAQPHNDKILVAGNHDRMFESDISYCLSKFDRGVIYLQDSGVDIAGFKFYGSPIQPWFYDWAFNVHRGPKIKEYWDNIPADTDVLITHGPPHGILDKMVPLTEPYFGAYDHLGCRDLMDAVEKIRPRVHIFGHIHGGYGHTNLYGTNGTEFYNAAICNEAYEPVNKPWLIEIEKD
jgi:Icc-related predicted phosphoesterase